METKVLNYRIIIEPDKRTGSGETCFTAYCPTFGIADSGETIEDAIVNIKKAIEAWIGALIKDGEPVPIDRVENSIVTFTSIKAPANIRFASL